MHCFADYQQSLPKAWLKSPTEKNRQALLEFSRGTLYSLCNSNKQGGMEVHTSRLRHAFARLGSPSLYRVGLRLLKIFREVESLPGGYWIPTPFRFVEIADHAVFIGALPTAFNGLGLRRAEGLCRILAAESAAQFPREDLSCWMGKTPGNSSSVVANFFHHHRAQAKPINHNDEVEYLNFNTSGRISTSKTPQISWSHHPVTISNTDVAMCRQKMFGFYRYFSSVIRSGRMTSESLIDQPIPRLLFALAHQCGRPVTVYLSYGIACVRMTIHEQLPIEEYRLAILLSRTVTRNARCSTFEISHQFAPVLIEYLRDLGCVMEIDQ
jgi:hypothetical protein